MHYFVVCFFFRCHFSGLRFWAVVLWCSWDCKHLELTAQTPSLIHVNTHRKPDSPKSTSLISLVPHISLQCSLTFRFYVLSGQRCMTEFLQKRKNIMGFQIPWTIPHSLHQLWQFNYHGSVESMVKNSRNSFFKKLLPYLAFLLTFDLTY